jgi:hypothetical protein
MAITKRLAAMLTCAILLVPPSLAWSLDLESESYRILDPSITCGSGKAESANYELSFTVNRHPAIGESTSESYHHYAGITPLQPNPPTKPGDTNGDGIIDREDINMLRECLNQSTPDCLQHDMDGDGKMTLLDIRKVILQCDCPQCICP